MEEEGLGNLVTCSDLGESGTQKVDHWSHIIIHHWSVHTASSIETLDITPHDEITQDFSICINFAYWKWSNTAWKQEWGYTKRSLLLCSGLATQLIWFFSTQENPHIWASKSTCMLYKGWSVMPQSIFPYKFARNTSFLHHSILTTLVSCWYHAY